MLWEPPQLSSSVVSNQINLTKNFPFFLYLSDMDGHKIKKILWVSRSEQEKNVKNFWFRKRLGEKSNILADTATKVKIQ